MSEDLSKQLQAALARIASLETEIAPLRSGSKVQPFDQRAFVSAMTRDPIGTLARYGVPKDHVTQVLVAQALRDQGQPVPPALEALTQLGPQVAATTDLAAELAALRQRVDASEKTAKGATVRESMKILAADKKKYPHLAVAYAADAGLFDEDIERHGGSAAELADALESRAARQAKAFGVPQPAQDTNAGDANTPTSKQGTAQASGSVAGNPPPLPHGRSKGFSSDDQTALRDEIVRNAERGVYDNPAHPLRPQ